jgi:hypothetical protein
MRSDMAAAGSSRIGVVQPRPASLPEADRRAPSTCGFRRFSSNFLIQWRDLSVT